MEIIIVALTFTGLFFAILWMIGDIQKHLGRNTKGQYVKKVKYERVYNKDWQVVGFKQVNY